MTTSTTRGKRPEDHKKPAGETQAELDRQREQKKIQDEILADLPELVDPTALRMRDKAAFRAILLDVDTSGLFDRDENAEDDPIEVDRTSMDPEEIAKIKALDTLCADIDDWAESIAVDKPAYAKWSGGKGYNEFFAILNRYQEALGESIGS